MKKLLSVLILSVVCAFCAVGLTACGVEFKINFIVDEEVYATVNTNGAETIKMPENPTKEDDVFDGWYWDKDTWEKPFTANSLLDAPLSSDMNVYAKWKGYNKPNANALLISANGFTMDGMRGKISVSNDTEVYSFINQIQVSDRATWVISRDIYGMQTVATKTIPLDIGDNTVYLLVTSGDGESISLYIMTVRRRTFYTVSFNTNGGTAASSQQVEEDSFAIEPITTRAGYTLDGWTYDFAQPITNNTVITAKWKANTDTPYQVKHYIQNLDDDNYALEFVENLTGTTDTQVSAIIRNDIPHYTYTKTNSIISGNLNGDGSTVLKVYYNLDKFTIRIVANGNVSLNKTYNGTYKYGETIPEIIATYTENMCYEWKGWYSNNEFLTKDTIIPSFTVERNINLVADCSVKQEMSNFNFTATATNCTITGVKDKTVTEIVVPDYVTNINAGAFSGCSKLVSLTMPFVGDSRKTASETYQYPFGYIFGTSSYSGGTKTQQYYYGSSTSSTTYTYYYIPSSLKTVTIIGGNLLLGAFFGCGNITDINLPNGLEEIGQGAFRNCTKLTNVNIPNSVTSICENAFYGCSGLQSVVIGNGLKTCGNDAFRDCNNLNAVYYTGDIAGWCSINWGDYSNPLWTAHNLYINNQLVTDLVIPDGVTYIGTNAFDRCSCLNSITIPNSVKTINERAFWYCTNLTSINFDGTKVEWQAISKGEEWHNQVPSNCVVHCIGEDIKIANA